MKIDRDSRETHLWHGTEGTGLRRETPWYWEVESTVTLYTEIARDIKRWKREAANNINVSVTEVGDYGLEVTLPKSSLRIALKRQMSEEEKQRRRERLEAVRLAKVS